MDTDYSKILASNAQDVLRKCGLSLDIVAAADSKIEQCEKDRADFYAMFPGAMRIRVDTSALPVRPRAPGRSDAADSRVDNSKSGRGNDAAGAKSFYEMFPDAARIRQL